MFDFAYYISSRILEFEGTKANLVASGIVTFIVIFSVIIIGAIANKIEQWQMRFLGRFFKPKTVMFMCNYLTCVGTVLHELAHATMGWMMGAEITGIRVLEINREDGRLGHVNFKTKGKKLQQKYQIVFISCAPVISGCLLVYLLFKAVLYGGLDIGWRLVGWYYIISIIDHMSMSSVDIKNYVKGIFHVAVVVFFAAWLITYLFVPKV